MRVAVVDGDVLAYQACAIANSNEPLVWGEDEPVPEEGSARPIRIAEEILEDWLELVQADDVITAISGNTDLNFRKAVHPEYKRKRSHEPKPEFYTDVVDYLMMHRNGKRQECLEGDDIMGLMLTSGKADVAISTDKDIFTLPGACLRIPHPRAKDPSTKTVISNERMANRFWMSQTVSGDSVDEYRGAPGAGPKVASKVLGPCISLDEMWEAVLNVYKIQMWNPRWGPKFVHQGSAFQEALMNARCARILRDGDYDWSTCEVNLWRP